MKKFLLSLLLLLWTPAAFAQDAIPCLKFTAGGVTGSAVPVKTGSAIMCGYQILNTSGAVCYMQVFDSGGAVSVGATVPALSLGFPAGSAANIAATQPGIKFTSGLQIAGTTTRAGSTGCTLDVNIWYK